MESYAKYNKKKIRFLISLPEVYVDSHFHSEKRILFNNALF